MNFNSIQILNYDPLNPIYHILIKYTHANPIQHRSNAVINKPPSKNSSSRRSNQSHHPSPSSFRNSLADPVLEPNTRRIHKEPSRSYKHAILELGIVPSSLSIHPLAHLPDLHQYSPQTHLKLHLHDILTPSRRHRILTVVQNQLNLIRNGDHTLCRKVDVLSIIR